MAKTFTVKVGSISWIHQQITPVKYLTDAEWYEPQWLPKTYIGLYATRNRAPPAKLDLPGYRGTKQFRAMSHADLDVETSDDGHEVTSVAVRNDILDPGWTPPFDRTITLLTRVYVPEASMEDSSFHVGQLGKGSAIIPRGRHRSTMISRDVPQRNLVANGFIFFRAGSITDDIGVNVVQCPYHVPWVWCEWLVAHKAGKFYLFGTGSVFPTHSFYGQGTAFGQQDEPTDARFVTQPILSGPILNPKLGNPRQIQTGALRVYPVLATGAPASGPQVADVTDTRLGPAASFPYAVAGSGYTSATSF